MNVSLTDNERTHLRVMQRQAQHKKNYVKITLLLGLADGNPMASLCALLGIDTATGYRYIETYQSKGLSAYLSNQYLGFWGKLNSFQLAALQTELVQNFYTDSQSVADWIAQTFGISYTAEGLVPLLRRLGFSYKKTKSVPCEAQLDKQRDFVVEFEQLMDTLKDDEAVFFADAVHPQHNTRSTWGWIAQGKEREVPTVSGRNRLNINGVVNAQSPSEVLVVESERINAQSTWELYQKLENAYPDKQKIYVICDNARYYKNKELTEKLKNSRIVQVFLPPYSPNLNLIERLWKFMRKQAIDNRFVRTFDEFRQQVRDFFDHIAQYKTKLETLLTLRFHLPFSQTNFF